MAKYLKPICSVCIGEDRIIESYQTGDDFYTKIWRLPHDQKITICFGHKFFNWLTHTKNKTCWIKNKCGTDLLDFDSWNKCFGYIEFNRRKSILVINVDNTK